MGKKSTRRRTVAAARQPERDAALAELGPPAEAPAAARWLWLAAAVLCAWSFGFTQMRGSDLWWHLASGRWMLEQRPWPLVDPWSFTHEGRAWLHHEWLADVLYWGWATLLGQESLVWWKWSVMAAAFALLFETLRRRTGSAPAAFAGMLLAVAVGAPFFDVRPHLYSLLGTVVLFAVLWGRARPAPLLPLLFLIWVNLHGGFFFGLMALAVLLGVPALLGEAPWRWRLALACAAVCLLNPNGFEAFGYPLKYAFDSGSPFRTLGEWHPPFVAGGIRSPLYPYAIGLVLAAAGGLTLSAAWRTAGGLSVSALVLSALTLAMSLRSRRFIPLFGIAGALLVSLALARLLPVLARWLQRHAPRRPGRSCAFVRLAASRRSVRLAPPVLALVLGIAWLAPHPISSRAFLYLTAEDTFPVDTLDFVEANGITGRVFAFYNWGGYLHLRTAGRLKVYIDGRADTVFDAETYLRYVSVLGLRPGWQSIVESSGAELVLWPLEQPGVLRGMLETGRWRVLHEDAVSALLARADSPLWQRPLRLPPGSAWRELAQASRALRLRQPELAETHYHNALQRLPHLGAACYGLLDAQLGRGAFEPARETLGRCQRLFPNPLWQAAFEAQIDRVSKMGG
jgi:hypothetical protein